MKLESVLKMIEKHQARGKYIVSFDKLSASGVLISDFFPVNPDDFFKTEEEAWLIANKFYESSRHDTEKYVNIIVNIYEGGFSIPVENYQEKIINPYPSKAKTFYF